MPPAKHREPVIPAKMKILIEELLHVDDLKAAAEKAGLSTYWARRYLRRPNILRYFREEKAAMLEAVRAGNIPALVKVRTDSSNGMAVVAAVRQLEAMGQTVAEETGAQSRTRPGLQIIIHAPGGGVLQTIGPQPSAPLQIEGEAERVAEMEP
jgi:hypothetical protein